MKPSLPVYQLDDIEGVEEINKLTSRLCSSCIDCCTFSLSKKNQQWHHIFCINNTVVIKEIPKKNSTHNLEQFLSDTCKFSINYF